MRHENVDHEFVCLIPLIKIDDRTDRELRSELRNLLNSLELQVSISNTLHVASYVWSMPFRLTVLQTRLRKIESGDAAIELVSEIVTEVEQARVALPLIEKGHAFEQERDFRARGCYLQALQQAPGNHYLIRHIAKMHSALGELAQSAKYWERLIKEDPHATHHARYAWALAGQGRFATQPNNTPPRGSRPARTSTQEAWGDYSLSKVMSKRPWCGRLNHLGWQGHAQRPCGCAWRRRICFSQRLIPPSLTMERRASRWCSGHSQRIRMPEG